MMTYMSPVFREEVFPLCWRGALEVQLPSKPLQEKHMKFTAGHKKLLSSQLRDNVSFRLFLSTFRRHSYFSHGAIRVTSVFFQWVNGALAYNRLPSKWPMINNFQHNGWCVHLLFRQELQDQATDTLVHYQPAKTKYKWKRIVPLSSEERFQESWGSFSCSWWPQTESSHLHTPPPDSARSQVPTGRSSCCAIPRPKSTQITSHWL